MNIPYLPGACSKPCLSFIPELNMSFFFLLLFLPLFVSGSAAKAFLQDQDAVFYVFTELERLEDKRLFTGDESEWRIMQDVHPETDAIEPGQPVIILLGEQREGRSGIAYLGGQQLSVSLVSGTPERKAGRRYSLLFADQEQRKLTFVNGDIRRVINREISLDFPRDRLVEMILTPDRQHMLDTSRGLRIPVSPVLRQ
jgi:hypothetical protein